MRSVIWIFLIVFVIVPDENRAADATLIKDDRSPAQEVNSVIGGSPARKEFSFLGGNSWLDAEGNFHLEMTVVHKRLLCAQYATHIQFGIGSQRCNTVTWISSPYVVSDKKHCNSAQLLHTGGNWADELAQKYGEISCARVQVHCRGRGC